MKYEKFYDIRKLMEKLTVFSPIINVSYWWYYFNSWQE
ncbi:hypothetical protein DESAMIL20_7 [Desulfurella amilsii]|uniref:Uncharacterized protein n=1 Tax=Desulfurella amilsii TaxID=1562698 RepID=A0A1X4XZC6_9BACT|nr:hypothetical protein DESAMIL20_7 [Desulfurella amilsii]